jgi:hypothetical protein
MNEDFNKTDERLSQALKAWKVDAPLPPRFQERVWERVTRSEGVEKFTLWAVFQRWLEAVLSRRAVALAYLVILLVAGSSAGYWHGREKSKQVESGLSERYLQMVDPYQSSGGTR